MGSAGTVADWANSELLTAFGTAFARSFAEYTYQMIQRLGGNQRSEPDLDPLQTIALTAADIPQWVHDEREKMLRGESETMSGEAAATFLVRDRLQRALREKNMRQAELARRMGTSPAVISRVFKSPHRCRLTTLQKIARELGVEVADILRRT